MIALLFILAINGFHEELELRHFDNALEIAGDSDSLRAEVFLAMEDYPYATLLFERVFKNHPSAGSFISLWQCLLDEPVNSMVATDLFIEEVRANQELFQDSETMFDLWELSFFANDSDFTDSLEADFLNRFQKNRFTEEIICRKFWDMLYPAWHDDSARVVVLREFLNEYGEYSDRWRNQAFSSIINAVRETSDSLSWANILDEWLVSCPLDPRPGLKGANFLLEDSTDAEKALSLAREGLILAETNWKPIGFDEQEWFLTESSIQNGLLFQESRALFQLGEISEAFDVLSPLLDMNLYHIDDYHTPSSFFWLAGEIMLQEADTSGAFDAFISSTIAGHVSNEWSERSFLRLSELCRDEDVFEIAREYMNYKGPVFEDVTYLLGPDSLLQGSRLSWGDFNNDGFPDLLLGSRLYRNDNGVGFIDVTELTGLSENSGNGGIWGDLDNNRWLDIVICGTPAVIYLNDSGFFTDKTHEMNFFPSGNRPEGIGLADWNVDGYLDIYLANYEKPGELATGTEDLFYLGGVDGFREVADSIGMVPFSDRHLCGRGVSPCDYDRDGDMDLFISNYRLQENLLWENLENGLAVNNALENGIAGSVIDNFWGHTIGSAWGDFDNDGDWDLFCANLAHPRYIRFSDRSCLFVNNGPGMPFTDVRADAGIRFEETHSNPLWGDFNNDGFLDLYITSIYESRRSFLYLNNGDGTFDDVTFLSGSRVFNGWGAATADFDQDGRLDLAVGSGNVPKLFRNISESGNWILIDIDIPDILPGSTTGFAVELSRCEKIWLRQIEGGSGTTSQNSAVLHFGLPDEGPYTWKLFIPGRSEPSFEGDSLYTGNIYRIP